MTDKIYVVTASANKGQDWIMCKALYGGILGSDIKKTAQAMLEEEYQDIKMHGKRIPRKYFKLTEYSDNAELLKQIEQLKAENAALRERLDKAIEPPCERDDIFYRFFQYPAEMVEDIACGFRKEKDGELYVCSANSESWYNVKECEFSREAAEARLKELQGGKQ